MAEKKKLTKLYDRLKKAGFSDSHYYKIIKAIDDASEGDIVEMVVAMDNDDFEDFFKTIVVPMSAKLARDQMKKFPHNADELANAQMLLSRSAESWDMERFKSTIGRKPVKDTVDGKEVSRPTPIGNITDQDYIALRNAGLSDEDIEKYTDKFTNEERRIALDRQLKISEKQRKAIDEEIRSKRERLAEEFDNDMYWEFSHEDGGIKRALKIAGNTALGTGMDLFYPEFKAEAVQSIKDARDYSKRALAKDFGFNTALAMTPIGVAKGVAKAGLSGVKNAAANFTGNFGLMTLENLARQGASDYYRMSLPSAALAAGVGATIPASVSMALLGINKYVPRLRRYTVPTLRRSKGLVEGSEASEVDVYEQAAEDAFSAITMNNEKIPKWKRNLANMVAHRESQKVAERLSKITGGEYNAESVRQMLSTKDGLQSVKELLQAPTPEMIGNATGDVLERYEAAFPGIVNEALELNTPTHGIAKGVDLIARTAEDYGGLVEPIREVHKWGRMPSDSLRYLMEVDPALVQRWGVLEETEVPDSLKGLYSEWKSKYKNNR